METKVLVAGRMFNQDVFTKNGLNVVAHWERMALERPSIPLDVEVVVLISNDVDVFLTRYIREECERNFIPLAFVRKEMTDLSACISKAVAVMEQQEEIDSKLVANAAPTKEHNMSKQHDNRSTGLNVQRKNQKMDLVRELLRKDVTTPTEEIQAEVMKKFGRGLTPSTITEVRVGEFNTKIGPRGTVNGTVASVAKQDLNTQDSLESILKKLTKIMQATGTDRVEIDNKGHVSIKGGTRELTLSA